MAKINKNTIQKLLHREQKSRHAMQEFGPGKAEYIICPDGGEAYYHKSWHHWLADFKHLDEKKGIMFKKCPFHQMVENKQYEGEIIVENVPSKDRGELIRLIERSGEHGYRSDPMDRIIKIETKKDSLRITTSENQLAQKIANKIRDRFKKTVREVRRGKRTSDVVSIKIIFPKI